jgi:serine/threonine protein kinase/tetratricopeptide (TPR) repeat protein
VPIDIAGIQPVEPETWRRIETLFLQAVELAPAERQQFLDSACKDDPRLRAEVDSLLAKDGGSDETISHALAQEAALLLKPPVLEGERMGAYRVLHEIGRGGMGAVYLAVRDDDQYQKHVAIKIVKRGMDTHDVLRRFRHERQILAELEHPYIARLLDGGCTHDGRPFLVMELVEGQPIDRYCREHQLPVEDRLRLFLKVCEAVSYAHRCLIVHRDLKPANILITGPDSPQPSSPKLLDFGLARILDAETGGKVSTALPLGPLTPDYASPEQLRGAALTTATDIYSLGVILHELLSGVRPQRLEGLPPNEWKRIIEEGEISRPSASAAGTEAGRLRRKLLGDLDNIVMLAMRREPERRYASVDELASDIRAYLESRPVHARQDSVIYRSGKFVRRRRYGLLTAAGVLLGLVGGIVAAVSSAHKAEAARRIAVTRQLEAQHARQAAEAEHRRAEEERDAAVSQRQVAEDRLTQMVDLSDRSLSDVYAMMERLAGGMPARQEMIGATLEFLEKLSKQAGGDLRLRLALAKAYRRLGDIQTDPSGVKAGGAVDALKSYRAAAALVEDTSNSWVQDRERLSAWLNLQDKTAGLLVDMKHGAQGAAILRKALEVYATAPAQLTRDHEVAHAQGCLYLTLSKSQHPDLAASLPNAEASTRILDNLAKLYPDDTDIRYDLSRAITERTYLIVNLKGPEAAAAGYQRIVDLREELHKERPTDGLYYRALVLAYMHYGNLEVRLNRMDQARAYYTKGRALAELSAADPQNLTANGDYAQALYMIAEREDRPEAAGQALADLRKSVAILERIATLGARAPDCRVRGQAYLILARRLASMGNYGEALSSFRRAAEVTAPYFALDPHDADAWYGTLDALRGLAETAAAAGDRGAASDNAATLMQQLSRFRGEPLRPTAVEGQIAATYASLAKMHRSLNEWEPARDAAQDAVNHAIRALNGQTGDPAAQTLREAQDLVAETIGKLSGK